VGAALLVLGAAAAPASAAAPCWKRLINDWYDGRIDSAYPVRCYREAIRNLPEDVQAYSSARDDITRALLRAIRDNGPNAADPGFVVAPAVETYEEVHADGGMKESPYVDDSTDDGETAAAGRDDQGGPLNDLLGGPENADSVPLPLLILTGLAFLLLAAAVASSVVRRVQARRVPVAPPQPPERP
jgi:hypothetical protein